VALHDLKCSKSNNIKDVHHFCATKKAATAKLLPYFEKDETEPTNVS